MEKTNHYSRDVYSLSNEEIIKLVDFIFTDYNLDRIVHSLYIQERSLCSSLTYRKIEVVNSNYEWAYVIKVIFGFKGLDRKITTGFVLLNEGLPGDENLKESDIDIQGIAAFYGPFENVVDAKALIESFGIDIDFSILTLYIKRLYTFLDQELRIWNNDLPEEMYLRRPGIEAILQIGNPDSFTVEEVLYPVDSVAL
jgi:hypothetical protein